VRGGTSSKRAATGRAAPIFRPPLAMAAYGEEPCVLVSMIQAMKSPPREMMICP
jgi:hypothetical protein